MRKVWKFGLLTLFLILSCLAVAYMVNHSTVFTTGDSWAEAKQSTTSSETLKPKVVISERRYEFKPLPEGQEVKHDFIIENHGQGLLNIEKVSAG